MAVQKCLHRCCGLHRKHLGQSFRSLPACRQYSTQTSRSRFRPGIWPRRRSFTWFLVRGTWRTSQPRRALRRTRCGRQFRTKCRVSTVPAGRNGSSRLSASHTDGTRCHVPWFGRRFRVDDVDAIKSHVVSLVAVNVQHVGTSITSARCAGRVLLSWLTKQHMPVKACCTLLWLGEMRQSSWASARNIPCSSHLRWTATRTPLRTSAGSLITGYLEPTPAIV